MQSSFHTSIQPGRRQMHGLGRVCQGPDRQAQMHWTATQYACSPARRLADDLAARLQGRSGTRARQRGQTKPSGACTHASPIRTPARGGVRLGKPMRTCTLCTCTQVLDGSLRCAHCAGVACRRCLLSGVLCDSQHIILGQVGQSKLVRRGCHLRQHPGTLNPWRWTASQSICRTWMASNRSRELREQYQGCGGIRGP